MAKRKVLFIGWDAADWKAMTPLIDAGHMPNVQRMIENGVMGNLGTLFPVLSPMLWTSIATGKRPFKHGIHGFSEPDPNTGTIRPITNLSRKTKAVWNILHQNDLKSNVIGWWPSHPAEPINGAMVSNHFQQAKADIDKPWPMRPGTVHPPELAERLKECRVHPTEIPGDALQLFIPDGHKIDQKKDRRVYQCAKIIAECTGIQAAATELVQEDDWDLMAVYFDGIDHFGHGFMKYHPPRQEWVKEEDFELYKGVIDGGYRYHDYMLGVLMQLAGDDVTVVLISDHGFHPDALRPRTLPNEPAGPAAEHRPFGIFAAMGPGIKKDDLVFGAGLLDICPTLLSLFDLPTGEDMDGRPLVSIYEKETEAKYIPSWDDVEGEDGRHPPDMQVDAVESQEAVNQLVALGYIEEPDADKEKAVAETVRELRYNLARSYIDALRHQEAIALFQELWNDWPEESRFGVHLFQCLLAVGQPDAAGEVFDEVKEHKTKYAAEAKEELQKVSEEMKAAQEAAKEKGEEPPEPDKKQAHKIRKLRARAGFNTHALAFLEGSLRHAQGKHEEAITALRKAEGVQVNNQPSLFQTLGDAHVALKRYDEAETEYRRALATDTINPAARLGLARVHLARNEFEKAAEEALAAVGQRFHNPQAHYVAGRALAKVGRKEEAVRSIETALSQNPVFPDAHRELGRIYQDEFGDWAKASKHRERARDAEQRITEWKAGHRSGEAKHAIRSAFEVSDEEPDENAAEEEAPNVTEAPPLEKTVVIVSGLPRSGTSMMMQMLAAGGFPVLTDEHRAADESNPKGYFELEDVKKLGRDNAWLPDAEGKVVKIIAQLLPRLPLQVRLGDGAEHPLNYRVILMRRPLAEIVPSQTKMLSRLDKTGGKVTDEQLAGTFKKQLGQVRKMLGSYQKSGRVLVLPVNYHGALKDPARAAKRVNAFLGGELDQEAMVGAVDATLHRERV